VYEGEISLNQLVEKSSRSQLWWADIVLSESTDEITSLYY